MNRMNSMDHRRSQPMTGQGENVSSGRSHGLGDANPGNDLRSAYGMETISSGRSMPGLGDVGAGGDIRQHALLGNNMENASSSGRSVRTLGETSIGYEMQPRAMGLANMDSLPSKTQGLPYDNFNGASAYSAASSSSSSPIMGTKMPQSSVMNNPFETPPPSMRRGNFVKPDSHDRLFGVPSAQSLRSKPNFMKSDIFGTGFGSGQALGYQSRLDPTQTGRSDQIPMSIGGDGDTGAGYHDYMKSATSSQKPQFAAGSTAGLSAATAPSYMDMPINARENGGNPVTGAGYHQESRPQRRRQFVQNQFVTSKFW